MNLGTVYQRSIQYVIMCYVWIRSEYTTVAVDDISTRLVYTCKVDENRSEKSFLASFIFAAGHVFQ